MRETGFAAFSMALLRCGDRYLMLQRASHKTFAPGRWTGIGGRVEPSEFDNLYQAALREIEEETSISSSEIRAFTLRRSLLQQRPGHPLTLLLYFTGEIDTPVTHDCEEGKLHWLSAPEIATVDVIENTALVIPQLIGDLQEDPDGSRPTITGAAPFDAAGSLISVVWSDREPGPSHQAQASNSSERA